jgi:hypothetical protein
MKAYRRNGCIDPYFLTSAQDGGELLASRHGQFITDGMAHLIVTWVGPRAGLNQAEKGKFLTKMGLENGTNWNWK